MPDTFKSSTQSTAADTMQQIEQLRGEIASLASTVAGFVDEERRALGQRARRLAGDLGERLGTAGEQAGALKDVAVEYTEDAAAALAREIRDKPLRSMAIAIGVGLIIGALSRGK